MHRCSWRTPTATVTDGDEVALKAVWPCLDRWSQDGDICPTKNQYGLNPASAPRRTAAGTTTTASDCSTNRYCRPDQLDTDGDGVWDGDSAAAGSCPTDPGRGSFRNCVTLKLTVGDLSGSNSERWNFECSKWPRENRRAPLRRQLRRRAPQVRARQRQGVHLQITVVATNDEEARLRPRR